MFRGLSLKWTEGFQGEEEIRDTNTPIFFRVPSFCLTDSYLGGRGVESYLTVRKIYQVQVLVILWPWSTRHLLQHNVTEDSVFVINHVVLSYFFITIVFLLYLYLVRVASNKTTPTFCEILKMA